VNLGGTLNILEAARQTGRRPFLLFTSTNKVYGNFCSGRLTGSASRFHCTAHDAVTESQPLDFHSPYGCSKGAADQYVRDYARIFNLPTVVFRMSCIAGPRQFGNEDQGWVAHFLYSALQERSLSIYGDGRQVRDVLYIEDLLRAFEGVRRSFNKTAGQVYNVGGGLANAISLLELVDEIEKLTGCRLHYDRRPVRPGDQPVYVSDYQKLQQHVGWTPSVGVRQMLLKMREWYQENQHLFVAAGPASRMPVPHFAQIPGVAV
jgi:CDP-paratose 2-epimerase